MIKNICFEVGVWFDAIRLTILLSWDEYHAKKKAEIERKQDLEYIIETI